LFGAIEGYLRDGAPRSVRSNIFVSATRAKIFATIARRLLVFNPTVSAAESVDLFAFLDTASLVLSNPRLDVRMRS